MIELDYCVSPESNINLEKKAYMFQLFLSEYDKKYSFNKKLDVERVLDTFLPIYNGFSISIVSNEKIDDAIEAQTCFESKAIEIREKDFEEQLTKNCPRFRYTCCHEIGHTILHSNQLLGNKNKTISLGRPKNEIPTFRRAEWQAEVIASCILMPLKPITKLYLERNNKSLDSIAKTISKTYLVSKSAALNRLKTIKNYETKGELKKLLRSLEKQKSQLFDDN